MKVYNDSSVAGKLFKAIKFVGNEFFTSKELMSLLSPG